jgi:hypothetical protein
VVVVYVCHQLCGFCLIFKLRSLRSAGLLP